MVDSGKTPDEMQGAGGTVTTGAIVGVMGLAVLYALDACVVANAFGLRDTVGAVHVSCFYLALVVPYLVARKQGRLFVDMFVFGTGARARKIGIARVLATGAAATAALCAVCLSRDALDLRYGMVLVGAMSAIAGMATGVMQLSWYGNMLKGEGGHDAARSVLLAFAGGFVVMLVLIWLDPTVSQVAMALMPLASAACLCTTTQQALPDEPREAAPDDDYLDSSAHYVLFAYLFVFGFCEGMFLGAWDRYVATAAMGVAFAVTLAYLVSKGPHRGIGDMGKYYLPVCMLLIFSLVVPSPIVMQAALVLAFAACTAQSTSNVSFLVNMARTFGIDGVTHISTGRFPPLAGLALGLTVSSIYARLPIGQDWRYVLPCALAMLLVFLYARLPFNQGNPMREGVIRDLDEGIVPWVADNVQTEELFKKRCMQAAEEKGLSPRESEVLFLLACGYNMTTIAEMLFVSVSTVKTHTYRIYRKFDVHSQQEIIVLLGPRQLLGS